MKMTQEKPPFTKEQVKQLRNEMYLWFSSFPKGPTIKLTVLQNSMLIGRIDWTRNNCAFSTLVLMLSSSNAGLYSINQQIFAGYILAVIINAIQETGSCDPIVLEAFRLELTNLSGNPVWSNWSELVEFHDLYNLCVNFKIINTDEVEFVPSNDDGSNVKKALNRKRGSTLVGAYKWVPSIHDLANGTLSEYLCSKHRITAVVLHKDDHFSIIILIDGGFFWIDGKGKRVDNFKAESSLRQLTIEQFQKLCAAHGAFYLFEEVPFVSENAQCVLLPPASSAQVAQVLPPPLPQPVPCANVAQALPPPPPHHCASGPLVHSPPPPYPCAQVSHAFHPPQQDSSVSGPLVPSPLPSSKPVIVWFEETRSPDYYLYDPTENILRSITNGSIIDDISAGSYQVLTKNTREFITIVLKEVPNPASSRPFPQQIVLPKSNQKIEMTDITICQGLWSITKESFSKSGTCMVALNRFTIDENVYTDVELLLHLNHIYKYR
jgi:hypothetical protein